MFSPPAKSRSLSKISCSLKLSFDTVTQPIILCHNVEQLKKTAMKTKNWLLTALALFMAVTGFTTDTPNMNIVASDVNKILVSFESETPCMVEMTITDEDGGIVHYWKSETPENIVNQRLNLSQLGKGTFNVTMNYGGTSINREINITRNEIKVGAQVKLIEPYFCFKNDRLNVSFLNVTSKKVFLNVYKDGEHYNGFLLGKDFDIQKCIDFSMAEKGNYEVVLTDYFKEHHYLVNK